MAPRYDILALDLDGTLLGPDGKVSDRNRAAVRAAREAGMAILPCTGRGFNECRHILAEIEHDGPVAVAGGAMLVDAGSGQTLHRFAMAPALVRRAAATMLDAGHAALVLKDRHAAGFDYLVVGGAHRPLDPVSLWWFEALGITTRFVGSLDADDHPEMSVRIGLVAEAGEASRLAGVLREDLSSQALLHAFPAVIGEHSGRDVFVLEVFDARAHKWSAIEWFRTDRERPNARVAAIGDHVNDVTMLRGADLGIAMGNAAQAARDAANVMTLSNADDGVAHAIGQMLEGVW